ncbi:MAG: DUF1028 domain-containing protein [Salinarimonas sp.]|nr:DUF1028 domain-containing protein [Salinarimonas sp.]
MTFSIVARCPLTGQFGIAAVTALPAVGKLVTHAHPGAGAVATQALLNPYLGIDGVRMLRDGADAQTVRAALIASDPCIESRQFGIVDANGQAVTHTGSQNLDWAGAVTRPGFAVQGNRLTGADVVHAIADAFAREPGDPLPKRLIEALEAGAAAGGDRDGERSATIYIVADEEYPLWDIRVDEHREPIAELRRLHDIFARELLPHIRRMPSRSDPAGSSDDCIV